MEATTAATGRPSMRETLLTRPVISWALYDLANTVFSMNIVSFYLGIWVVTVMGQSDAVWGYTGSLTYAVVFVTAPILGALSDQAGRRMPFLHRPTNRFAPRRSPPRRAACS